MGKYIAFLRGINVGGKNKVSMPELKALFEQNGFTDVSTYINSGNIIFSTENTDEKRIKEACEMFIRQSLHLNISVAVLSAGELKAALAHAPLWWGENENSKHNAFLIVPPVTVAEVFKEVGTIKPDYEKVDYYGNVVFWSAPIGTFSRTRWSKVVGSSLYGSITIRNANTMRKLAQMAE